MESPDDPIAESAQEATLVCTANKEGGHFVAIEFDPTMVDRRVALRADHMEPQSIQSAGDRRRDRSDQKKRWKGRK